MSKNFKKVRTPQYEKKWDIFAWVDYLMYYLSKWVLAIPCVATIIKYKNLAVVVLFCAIVFYVIMNRENFDGSASRRIPVNQLYSGYWDGFNTSNGRLLTGRDGYLTNNLTRWSRTEPKYIRPSGEEGFILIGPWVTLPAGYYEVHYFIEVLEGNAKDALLTLDIFARGTVFARTEINLYDLGAGIHELPIFFYLNDETEHVEWRARVTDGVTLRLTRTTIYKRDFIQELVSGVSVNPMNQERYSTFFVTNNNWERGFSRRFTGFFVPNISFNRERYAVGNLVEVAPMDFREIHMHDERGVYLHVHLQGEPFYVDRMVFPTDLNVQIQGEIN